MRSGWFLGALAITVCACGYDPPPEPAVPGSSDPLSYGNDVYEQNCIGCHGDKGQGKENEAPAVIGRGALPADPPKGAKTRKGRFEKAGDVATFIKAEMPPLNPGSLNDREALAVTLYLLREGGAKIPALDEKYRTVAIPR